jgi:hypothetical protein
MTKKESKSLWFASGFVMIASIIMIGFTGIKYQIFGGDLGMLVCNMALLICLFIIGAFIGITTIVFRMHAKTVKEIRMASCWQVDYLTDEIRECHNLEDNQA